MSHFAALRERQQGTRVIFAKAIAARTFYGIRSGF